MLAIFEVKRCSPALWTVRAPFFVILMQWLLFFTDAFIGWNLPKLYLKSAMHQGMKLNLYVVMNWQNSLIQAKRTEEKDRVFFGKLT